MSIHALQHKLERALSRHDNETAIRVAHHLVHTYEHPPAIALSLVGPRPGWRHPAKQHF